jgi:hypothetical protein
MREIRTFAVCLALALTGSAVVGAAASAALPEFGRCLKAGKTGAYKYHNCVALATSGTGAYEWFPGPGPKSHFAANFGYSNTPEAILRTTGEGNVWKIIKCEYNVSEGEYTGPKTLNITMTLFQCHYPGSVEKNAYCQKLGPAGEWLGEIVVEATGKLGYWEKEGKKEVGIDLKPTALKEPFLALWECGGAAPNWSGTGTGVLMALEGSVIGQIKEGDLNRPTPGCEYPHFECLGSEYYTVKYEVSNNHQVPENLEGEPKDTLVRVSPPLGPTKTSEPAVLSAEEEVNELEETIEIKG